MKLLDWIAAHGSDIGLNGAFFLLGAGLSWFIQHQYRARSAKIIIQDTASRVLRHIDSRLRLAFDDPGGERAVSDPYLLTVEMHNAGNADLRSAAFEAGLPLVLSLGTAKVIEVSSAVEPKDGELVVKRGEQDSEIMIEPGMLKAGRTLRFTAVVDGAPHLSWNHDHLADTPFLEPREADASTIRGSLVAAFIFVLLGAVCFWGAAAVAIKYAIWFLLPASAFGVLTIMTIINAFLINTRRYMSYEDRSKNFVETLGLDIKRPDAPPE